MGKLKKVISRIPLMPALIIVMSFFIIVAVILSKTTMSFVSEKIQLIEAKYIHYNCVGAIFIPEVFPLPVPEVSVNTRKGVVVNYAPCQVAI